MSFVYAVVTVASGNVRYVKFGLTDNVAARVKNLQTGCPLPFARAWFVDCGARGASERLEAALHEEHAGQWQGGEWFTLANDGHAEQDAHDALLLIAQREIGVHVEVREHTLPSRQARKVGRLQRRTFAALCVGDVPLPEVKYRRRRHGG